MQAFEKLFNITPEIDSLIQRLTVQLDTIGQCDDLPLLRGRLLRALNPAEAFEHAAEAVARGNLKVFAEMAPLFVRFLEEFNGSPAGDDDRLARFCATLRPGEPPEGQTYLAQAFTAYHAGQTESAMRPELQFLANLLIGVHEQTRLQPEILEALNAAIGEREEIRERLLRAIHPILALQHSRHSSRWFGRRSLLDRVLDKLIEVAQQCIREVITHHLMTLHLPHGEELRLGWDLPARAFPADLQKITHHELAGLLARIDPTPESLADSGARDWADFADRMHFITDYFRCYHDETKLFEDPFSSVQVEDLKYGKVPQPPL
jgi:hypothetical protein